MTSQVNLWAMIRRELDINAVNLKVSIPYVLTAQCADSKFWNRKRFKI